MMRCSNVLPMFSGSVGTTRSHSQAGHISSCPIPKGNQPEFLSDFPLRKEVTTNYDDEMAALVHVYIKHSTCKVVDWELVK